MVDKCEMSQTKVPYSRADHHLLKIINNTFKPLLESNEELPADLAPKLLHRFTSHEGYELRPGTKEALSHLRDEPRTRFENVVVGVITNSDPRVPDVLSSLGLKVSPLRYGTESQDLLQAEQAYHVDFSVMSYDVGVEKPNKKIFDAAVEMLDPVLKGRGDLTTSRETKDWKKIYVGDEYEKDVEGANKAGWAAVLISEEPVYADDETDLVKWAGDEPPGDLMNVLAGARSSVAFASVQRIADWLKL